MRAFFLASLLLATSASASIQEGVASPNLVAPIVDKNQIFDLAKLKGKVVMVHFWATWCPPCRKEIPELNKYFDQSSGKGLEIIGVSEDRKNDRFEVLKRIPEIKFPILLSADATQNGFGKQANLPLTVLIGRDGKVIKVFKSFIDEKIHRDLSEALELALAK